MSISCEEYRERLGELLEEESSTASATLTASSSNGAAPDIQSATQSEAAPESRLSRAEVEAHIATCAHCTRDLAALRQISEELRALPMMPPPSDLRARVRAELEAAASTTPSTALPALRRHGLFTVFLNFFRQPINVAWTSTAALAVFCLILLARSPERNVIVVQGPSGASSVTRGSTPASLRLAARAHSKASKTSPKTAQIHVPGRASWKVDSLPPPATMPWHRREGEEASRPLPAPAPVKNSNSNDAASAQSSQEKEAAELSEEPSPTASVFDATLDVRENYRRYHKKRRKPPATDGETNNKEDKQSTTSTTEANDSAPEGMNTAPADFDRSAAQPASNSFSVKLFLLWPEARRKGDVRALANAPSASPRMVPEIPAPSMLKASQATAPENRAPALSGARTAKGGNLEETQKDLTFADRSASSPGSPAGNTVTGSGPNLAAARAPDVAPRDEVAADSSKATVSGSLMEATPTPTTSALKFLRPGGGFGGSSAAVRRERSERPRRRRSGPHQARLIVVPQRDLAHAQLQVTLSPGLRFGDGKTTGPRVLWRGTIRSGQPIELPVVLFATAPGPQNLSIRLLDATGKTVKTLSSETVTVNVGSR